MATGTVNNTYYVKTKRITTDAGSVTFTNGQAQVIKSLADLGITDMNTLIACNGVAASSPWADAISSGWIENDDLRININTTRSDGTYLIGNIVFDITYM